MFAKDDSHQIYRTNVSATAREWHLAHRGVAGSVMYASVAGGAASSAPPPADSWQLGPNPRSVSVPPAPLSVSCRECV